MKKIETKNLALCSLFAALIAVGAFIRIPVPVVPFTLQVLFTTLAGLLLGANWGAAAVCAYMFMGLLGLPVFTQGGGPQYVLQPSFGYIVGFAFGAFVTGRIAHARPKPSILRLLAASLAGLGVVFLIGVPYYYLISKLYLGSDIGAWALVLYCFLVFLPGDVSLCVLSALLSKRLIPILRNEKCGQMDFLKKMTEKALGGQPITRKEALRLYAQPLEELCRAADEIRRKFCGNSFDLCTIVNAKSGRCSEDCKFCAQSARYRACGKEYPLLSAEELLSRAKAAERAGIPRFSLVASGKRLSEAEVESMCVAVRQIKRETGLSVCVSFGLLNEEQFSKLKAAGVERVHNNLETSRKKFPNICTAHTFEDKLAAIRAAQKAGLEVCSGGIVGLGESAEDRIDLAHTLRNLGVKSVPLNMLNPIAGTLLQGSEKLSSDEMRRIAAVFRFLLPDAAIRLAGGRGIMEDKGRGCFCSGANAAITGDMLTTAGIGAETDRRMLAELGFTAEKIGR